MKKKEKYTAVNYRADAEAFLLGFILMGAQIILLREFMLVFRGNELVIGLLLALWMFIGALGTWSGKFLNPKLSMENSRSFLFLLLLLLPLISAFSVGFFLPVLFETGRMLSFYETMVYAFVLLFPLSFTGGLLFFLINHSAEKKHTGPQKIYAIEALGSLVGGVLVGLVFIYLLGTDNFKSLAYLSLIGFIFLGILSFRRRKMLRSSAFLVLAILGIFFARFVDLGFEARKNLFPNQQLISSRDTPYGSIDITQSGGQQNIYENGTLIFATSNVIGKEEDVHYAMLQRPGAQQVLLLGGGLSGTPFEILKYKQVEQLDYLELNPHLFQQAERFLESGFPKRVHTIPQDPVLFVKNTTKKYDVVLVNQPAPSTAQTNRFYTFEFYTHLKNILNKKGLVATRLPVSENYLSDEELELESVVFKTLSAVFKQVELIPGRQHYLLASDDSLSLRYSEMFRKVEISNHYVNNNYVNDRLLQMRSEALRQDLLKDVSINHDFKPIVYLAFVKKWLRSYGNRFHPFLWFAGFAVLLFLIVAKPAAAAMFSSGFAGASVEIVLLMAFQSVLGFLYLFLGLMLAVFMGGLVAGSLLSSYLRTGKNKTLLYIQMASGLFILLLIALLEGVNLISEPWLIQFAYGCFMFVVAGLVGLQYGAIFRQDQLQRSQLVSVIYPSDLLGAGIGSFVTSLWLIPVYGIYRSLFFIAMLHFITFGIVFYKQKRVLKK